MFEILADIVKKGGLPILIVLLLFLFLSILALSIIFERLWFWSRVLPKESLVFNAIIETAIRDWDMAKKVAQDYSSHPLGNFLYEPLRLSNPEPEVFHLALEAAADDQLALMRRGDKILEAIIALSPLLGLLGTVIGLIRSIIAIDFSDLGTANTTTDVTAGIGESLVSTAIGLAIAIVSLFFYRLFQVFWFNQVRVFRKAGSELEVIYRQRWIEEEDRRYPVNAGFDAPETVDN